MFSILSLILTSTLSFGLGSTGDPNVEYREYDFNGVEKITITNTSGKIRIAPMSVNKVEITSNKRRFPDKCSLSVSKDLATQIVIKVGQPTDEICEVDFDLRVPPSINLEITSGTGNVAVEGVNGALTFKLGTGDLKAIGKFKSVDGSSGTGSVDVSGVTGPANVKVGLGAVKLGFDGEPKGKVAVSTGKGNATLLFPKGTKMTSSLTSALGQTVNEIEDTPRAELNVSVSTGMGQIAVKSY